MSNQLTTLAEWKATDRSRYKLKGTLMEDGKPPVAMFVPTEWADDGSFLPEAHITGGPDDAMKAVFLWSVDVEAADVERRKAELAKVEKQLARMRETAATF